MKTKNKFNGIIFFLFQFYDLNDEVKRYLIIRYNYFGSYIS